MMPSSVDEVIEAAIRRHPWYANRTQVLHQWFCVAGNGMRWQDGAIVPKVSEERDETPEEWIRHIIQDPWEELKDALPEAWARQQLLYAQECAKLHANRLRAAGLARTPGEVEHLADYRHDNSMLLNQIPDDVRPDWAAAAQEIIDYLDKNRPAWRDPR